VPIYEYTCRACQDAFELLIRGQEVPQCPSCGGNNLEKQFSVPAAHSTRRGASLPTTDPPSGGCGRPQCGGGFCAGM
jgi:putative FmdB family regulatory protein